jgi:CHAT domain-containing protein
VAMPHSADADDLPGAASEAAMLAELIPGTRVLTGAQATRQDVSEALRGSRWAHFACHATSDLAEPSASYLQLAADERLTLPDVDLLRLEQAGLAYLSACATARTGTRLADEAISLSAGFQLAGYRQAIATLWPAADLVAARIAHDVYSALTAAAVDSAAPALHQAVRRRRDAVIDRPSAWAAYVHNGV